MKWKQSSPISVIITLAACGVSAQVVTYSGKLEEQIPCDVSSTSTAQWNEDLSNGTNIPLFTLENGQVTSLKPQLRKYDDFSATLESAEFILTIRTVEKNDGGTYACSRFGTSSVEVELEVEVPTDQMSISCESCDGGDTESTCQCTCFAEGGYPQSLNITWNVDPGRTASIQQESEMKNGKYDFTGTADVTVTGNEAVVTCSVKGYVNQADIENDFSNRVIQEQTLTSPTDCGLTLEEAEKYPDGDCSVQLNCLCQGVPSINTCTFYNGTQDNDIPDKNSCNINHRVPLGTEATFLCSGSNGINFGQDVSDPVSFKCLKGTTTIPSTTPDSTTVPTLLDITSPINDDDDDDNATTPIPTTTMMRTDTPETSSLGIIITFSCLGGILVLVVIGGLVYWFCIRNGENGKGGSNDNTDGNGVNAKLAEEQPEYAAVNKPKSQPQAAPRSSQPPDNKEQVELQYADLDHGKQGAPKEVRQPANEPTEYATVQSVIV